jgi:hypothetical protein
MDFATGTTQGVAGIIGIPGRLRSESVADIVGMRMHETMAALGYAALTSLSDAWL